jgi:hypothetical protein
MVALWNTRAVVGSGDSDVRDGKQRNCGPVPFRRVEIWEPGAVKASGGELWPLFPA